MNAPKVVFLGTPQAAVPSLTRLLETAEVQAVITRPDRPRGRSGTPLPSPVKAAATAAALAVHEAARGSDLDPAWFAGNDVAVVVAFGVLVPESILALPAHEFVNVHFSLLPRWRGASPVTAAIAAGDEDTGVTLMHLDSGLDTGPILAAHSTPIGPQETGGELTERLSIIGAELLARTLPGHLEGKLAEVTQDDNFATYAPRLGKDDLRFDFGADPTTLARKVRALAPKPGLSLDLDSGAIRLLAVRPEDEEVAPGELVDRDGRVLLGVNAGSIELLQVQPAGRRAMTGPDWVRGWQTTPIVTQ